MSGLMPGSGKCWFLQELDSLSLARMSSLLHAAACLARGGHVIRQRESCHQIHLLRLGLPRLPETRVNTPLSLINLTVSSIPA